MGGTKPPIEILGLFKFQLVHCGDTEATVNVNYFTRDTGSEIGAQKCCGVAHIFNGNGAANRRNRFTVRQHFTKIFNARSGECTD